jgi:hypothetical protein
MLMPMPGCGRIRRDDNADDDLDGWGLFLMLQLMLLLAKGVIDGIH